MMSNSAAAMTGKTCLVTGATSGIGQATARILAGMGATVLLVARDRERGEATATAIRRASPEGRVELFVADLASLTQVRQLAADVCGHHARLDVLINNAAVAPSERHHTLDGLEATFVTNHLGPFLLTHLLLDRLEKSAPARIVNVASYTHNWVKSIPWDDLQSETGYDSRAVYNLTKLMDVLFTYELARRLADTDITVNCLHPGWPLKTNLDREASGRGALFVKASKLFGKSAEKGAATSVYLASSPEVAGISGRYFANCRPAASSALSHDQAAAARLWELSEQLCGLEPALCLA